MGQDLGARITDILDQHLAADGHFETTVPGLHLMRSFGPMPVSHMVYRPTLCVVAQGAKEVMVGGQTVRYGHGQTMVVTINAPVLSYLVEASVESPYIGAILELDLNSIVEVAKQIRPKVAGSDRTGLGFEVHDMDAQLVGSLMRLLALVDDPQGVDILYPSIMREIAYWLVQGPAGRLIMSMAAPNGQPQRIVQAMSHLRSRFDETISVDALAKSVNMSPSAFHQNFRALTGMSPLQYQKHFRLLEARRSLLNGGQAGAAAVAVGYESVSQFNREYHRMFGTPPGREMRARSFSRGAEGRQMSQTPLP